MTGHAAASRGPSDRAEAGERMHGLIAELYPICRSITGDGVRETLGRIGAEIPLRGRRGADRDRGASTGPSRASGTSATPTSRTWPASG